MRRACAWVASRARLVAIDERAAKELARRLRAGVHSAAERPPDPGGGLPAGDRELRAAFVLCLNATNFGSGWWPTIRRRPGRSGYFTMATALEQRFRAGGWSAAELAALSPGAVARVFGQDARHPLMALYAASLRDVGEHVARDHGGSFAAVLDAAGGSARALVDLLARWRSFADVSRYEGREVPFFKRAQIAAADAHAAGVARFADRDRLTAFADNLVPHVLRVEGVLRLQPSLARVIDEGGLLEHGSAGEVELRACAVHAVELMARADAPEGAAASAPADVDSALWHRGQEARYKRLPRPRCRTTAY